MTSSSPKSGRHTESVQEPLREAFILRHVEGLSTKAAAAKLGIEESALKVRVYRARQELRKLLMAYQDESIHRNQKG